MPLKASRIQLIAIYTVVLVVLGVALVGITRTNRGLAEFHSDRDELAGLIQRATSSTDEGTHEIAAEVDEFLARSVLSGVGGANAEMHSVVHEARETASLMLADRGSGAGDRLTQSLWDIHRWYGRFIEQHERSYSIILGFSAFGLALALAAGVGLDLFLRQVERDRRRAHEFARNRIATIGLEQRSLMLELHDTVSQNLASAQMILSTIDGPHLEDCRGLLSDTRRLISDIARRLHPAELDQLGLASALQQLVDDYRRIGEMEIDVTVSKAADAAVDGDTRIHVYRIAQEALTNALTHSEADRVTLVLDRVADTVWLVVNDDGKGFVADRSNGVPGFGVMSMNERANILDGTFAVLSHPGSGTRVSLQFPVRPEGRS